jgi:hypothetical protein
MTAIFVLTAVRTSNPTNKKLNSRRTYKFRICTTRIRYFLLLQVGMRKQSGDHSRFGSKCVLTPWQYRVQFKTSLIIIICGLFNDAINNSDYIASNDRRFNESWIRKDVEGSCLSWPSLRHYPNIWLEGLRKTTKSSPRIADVRAKIRTRNLSNTKQEC